MWRFALYHVALFRFTLFIVVLGVFGTAQASEQINSVRIWPAPDHTRLVFDLSGGVSHKVFSLSNPSRLVIDIDDVALKASLSNLDLGDTPIRRVRHAVKNGHDLRVVLDLSRSIQPRSFLLKPNQQYGNRLVVDLVMPEKEPTETVERRPARGAPRNVLIAIDPGHGGEDPGARGPDGTFEKNVVMAIARKLKRQISAQPGYEAFLTRTGDYYVGLRERVNIARKRRADMFVSIHADAYRTAQPRGSSVYALSQRGATSETARWLADSENNADLIGGVEGVLSLEDKDAMLRGVLLDLSMTATLSESLRLGSQVLGHIGQINRLHKRDVEQAGFVVLKSPDMPSILVETGFISNPREERNLKSSAYQQRMASSIMTGIRDYFQASPPPNTLLAEQKRLGTMGRYVIAPGDTLSEIAQRKQVDLRALRRANNLSSKDVIRVGQVLRIPSS
ncbi:N-acetylmuramoyl-L-alanine amidase [Terasakiispira papahanaumokuakeensis]|uniref:N-acetylmuramoyl-L-alanine amidase AmiC n=1 Tax=Terasakiispira papahanaumokuakeensis TaxID=197479 RepID=A0A1E2V617_9GAMM|nr:N-acetylmuramoyl-L-alanine amidase [Terasakiispira papahanaumokuakeensis]ODC02421.1 N-acetylmuramoyl-L-alanine amidase [Terasakiispira papahanaumokuakeensis]